MADRRGRAACERGPGHAAYRHVRACRLIEHDPDPKGRARAKWRPGFPSGQTRSVCPEIMLNYKASDGSSLATLRRSVGRMRRLAMRPPSDSESPRIKKPATGFRRGLNSCDVEHMPVICPTCQIFSKTVSRNARHPSLEMGRGNQQGNSQRSTPLMGGRNSLHAYRPTGAAGTQRKLDDPPTQTPNFLDCRLKTANVPRRGLPIQLIPNIKEFHGRN